MEVEEVKRWLAEIEGKKNDPEAAHAQEDDLYFKVLTSISHDPHNAQELALEALKAGAIDFFRWYA